MTNSLEIRAGLGGLENPKYEIVVFRRAGAEPSWNEINLPNFLRVRCILIVSAQRIHQGIEHVTLLGS